MSAVITKSAIVKAMLKLVRSKKFADITVEDICEKANVSRRTFYRYYSDKHALLKDVFVECFFSKIDTDNVRDLWDIILEICKQAYQDKKFFRHSFEVKGQNGFWEEVSSILMPYFQRDFPSNEFDRMRDFFISSDIQRAFVLIENWIKDGMPVPPEEFVYKLRIYYYMYGTWVVEHAEGRPRTEFDESIMEEGIGIR